MPAAPTVCNTHADLFKFTHPLKNLAKSLQKPGNVKIVAIGSSSTVGEGDVVPYPARLAMLMRDHFHDRVIDVLKAAGFNLEAVRDELENLRDLGFSGPIPLALDARKGA